jgi:allophanate hydrolase subunit 1
VSKYEVLTVGEPRATVYPRDPLLGGPEESEYRVHLAGDTALVVEFGDVIDRRISAKVLALARRLAQIEFPGVVECVPTFRSLMVHYDPLVLSTVTLCDRIADLATGLRSGRTLAGSGACPPATIRELRQISTMWRIARTFPRRRSSSATPPRPTTCIC